MTIMLMVLRRLNFGSYTCYEVILSPDGDGYDWCYERWGRGGGGGWW